MPFTLTKTVRRPTRITDLCDIKQTRYSTEYEALCFAECERDDDYVVTLTNDESRDCSQSLGNVPLRSRG